MASPSRKRRTRDPPASVERQSLALQWPNRITSVAALTATFAALTLWSWRKWADVLVDFGQQLYIPWRLAGGDHLYKDILLMHGPLSQHLNALLFRVFGPSLTVLIVVNLAVLGGITLVTYRVFRLAADRLTATLLGLLLLSVFGFSQYVGTGNYNYVTPYTHESTHGMLLSLGLLYLMSRYIARHRRTDCVGAGLCLGLALLTKVDIAAASAGVAVAGLGAAWISNSDAEPVAVVDIALFVLAAVTPLAVFLAYFLSYLPFPAAFLSARSGFALVSSEVTNNPFYLRVLGFDDVFGNAATMLAMSGWILGAIVAAAISDFVLTRLTRKPHLIAMVSGAVLLGGLIFDSRMAARNNLARALPVTTFAAFVTFAVLFWRGRFDPVRRRQYAPMVLWAVFAMALLSKMVLNAQIGHYGFYLAMPATLLLASCLVWWLPEFLFARYRGGTVFRSLGAAVLIAMAISYPWTSEQDFYRLKTLPLGKGGDRMLTFGHPTIPTIGSVMRDTLQWIEANTPATATFAALPEGITLNYLARRPTTLPVINFMMTEEIVFGEDVMLDAFERRPPDYVLLVHKNTSEFGFGAFGDDPRYGRRIMEWVRPRYDPVALFGAEPFVGQAFGIRILKRK